jgi:hypothetical protein
VGLRPIIQDTVLEDLTANLTEAEEEEQMAITVDATTDGSDDVVDGDDVDVGDVIEEDDVSVEHGEQ